MWSSRSCCRSWAGRPFLNPLLPKVGLEPTPPCEDRILRPARLPIPPLRPFLQGSQSRFLCAESCSFQDTQPDNPGQPFPWCFEDLVCVHPLAVAILIL